MLEGSLGALMALTTLSQATSQIATGVSASDIAKQRARSARLRAAEAAEDERRKGRRLKGTQRAMLAKAGVDINEGTPLDVLAQTTADAETNALRAALAHEQQAEDFESTGRIALTQGILGAGQTILGGAMAFYDAASGGGGRKTPIPYGSVHAPSGSYRRVIQGV
jgi:multidrug efflux pump subunit AcrA (membrane-fusion protein)